MMTMRDKETPELFLLNAYISRLKLYKLWAEEALKTAVNGDDHDRLTDVVDCYQLALDSIDQCRVNNHGA